MIKTESTYAVKNVIISNRYVLGSRVVFASNHCIVVLCLCPACPTAGEDGRFTACAAVPLTTPRLRMLAGSAGVQSYSAISKNSSSFDAIRLSILS